MILARGLGSRMRRSVDGVDLDPAQQQAADAGVKAMISVGRPFLDHVISDLADAGFTDVCLVLGPEHDAVREYYDTLPLTRVTVSYAIQPEPLGTADALAAAEAFAAGERVLMINSDNFYPAHAVARLRDVPGSGTLGFARDALVAHSNIPADRVAAYAVLDVFEGVLTGIIEKPDADTLARFGDHALVSMNCWLFEASIFDAIARTGLSPRGEYEIVDAVRLQLGEGVRFDVVPVEAGVLDLSSRSDIAAVADALRGHEVRL